MAVWREQSSRSTEAILSAKALACLLEVQSLASDRAVIILLHRLHTVAPSTQQAPCGLCKDSLPRPKAIRWGAQDARRDALELHALTHCWPALYRATPINRLAWQACAPERRIRPPHPHQARRRLTPPQRRAPRRHYLLPTLPHRRPPPARTRGPNRSPLQIP